MIIVTLDDVVPFAWLILSPGNVVQLVLDGLDRLDDARSSHIRNNIYLDALLDYGFLTFIQLKSGKYRSCCGTATQTTQWLHKMH